MSPERALVTGGAGCIGSALVERLLARGHQVSVLDNLSSGTEAHLAACAGHPRFAFVHGDLLDLELVDALVADVETVYHLAANPDVKLSPDDPTDRDLQQNVLGTYHVLESMRRHGVRRLAFASTSAVYGLNTGQPIPEDHPLRPISLYGASKAGAEALIGAFHHLFGLDAWIFRFANIVGPRVRRYGRTVVGDFIDKLQKDPGRLTILGDGRQAKSYLLVDECLDAMLCAMDRAPAGMQIFNLGCEDALPVRRIADLVVEALGLSQVQYALTGGDGGWPGDVPRFRLDVTRIGQLGWRARFSSEEAVRQSIAALVAGAACRS